MADSFNHLKDISELRNIYVAVRHGQSEANVLKIISCEPDDESGFKHGLSDAGKAQAESIGLRLSHLLPDFKNREVHIYSSDFARTKATARIGYESILPMCSKVSFPIFVEELRERSFGAELNLTSDANYSSVWAQDERAEVIPGMRCEGVETVFSVQARSSKFVASLEKKHSGVVILLVGHGDLLQILQTAFEQMDARKHRSLPHLETCGLRLLEINSRESTGSIVMPRET